MSSSAIQLTGDYLNDNMLLMRAATKDILEQMRKGRFDLDPDDETIPPIQNKGRLYDAFVLDPFRRLGQRLFNPDKIRPETRRLMMKDPQISGAVRVINATTLTPGWDIVGQKDGAIKKHIEYIQESLTRFDFDKSLKEALTSFHEGYNVHEILLEKFRQNGKIRVRWKGLKPLPPESIFFDVTPQGDLIQVVQSTSNIKSFAFNPGRPLETADPLRRGPSSRRRRGAVVSGGLHDEITFKPREVAIITFWEGLTTQYGNFYGDPALNWAYKVWFYKEWIERHQNRYLELIAGGILIANAGRGSQAKLGAKVNMLKSNANITLKEGQSLDVIKPQSAGSAFLEWINYLDSQIMKVLGVPVLLLGQNSKFGSRSLSDTHFKLFQQTTIMPNQKRLETWANTLFRRLINQNFGPQKAYPVLKFRLPSIEVKEKIINYLSKGFKIGIFGANDIAEARDMAGFVPGEPGMMMQMMPFRDSSGGPGDTVARDTDAGSSDDNDPEGDIPEELEAAFDDFANSISSEMEEKFNILQSHLQTTLDRFSAEA